MSSVSSRYCSIANPQAPLLGVKGCRKKHAPTIENIVPGRAPVGLRSGVESGPSLGSAQNPDTIQGQPVDDFQTCSSSCGGSSNREQVQGSIGLSHSLSMSVSCKCQLDQSPCAVDKSS